MKIIVKDIKGYEGLYIIDSIGNVVSLPKQNGSMFFNEYRMLKPKTNKYGYVEVALTKEGKTTTKLLHRLLAETFIPNPDLLPCVNHKNGMKADNRIENLEWCTRSQNTKHAYTNNLGNFRETCNAGIRKMNYETEYVHVVLIGNDGREYTFSCTKDAADFVGKDKDEVTRAIRKGQRVNGYKAFGVKRCDLR